jgi:Zn-dependent M32 family carboxypeptidase
MGQEQSLNTINRGSNYTLCDAACEREKKIEQLKNTYDRAIRDDMKDSEEVRQARKQYFTFKYGPGGYNVRERETLENVANKNAEKLKMKHDDLVHEINEQQAIKNDNTIALKNMRELLDKIRASNNKLESELDERVSTLETSQRRIWYTNKKEDKYAWFSNILTIILRVVLFFSIIYLLYQKKYISLVIILILYLLIMHFL